MVRNFSIYSSNYDHYIQFLVLKVQHKIERNDIDWSNLYKEEP